MSAPYAPAVSYRTGSLVSADGTAISYRIYGSGPGVVLLHGGLQAAQNFDKLALALGDSFTVFVPDRRGRGKSGPFGASYGLAAERADLDALLRETGARCVFGLSSGAAIALYAARTLSAIERLALYEPPLTVRGAQPGAWVPEYERALERGDLPAAIVAAIKGTSDQSALAHVPRALLVAGMRLAMRLDAADKREDHVTLRALIPTMHYDAQLVHQIATESSFRDLRCPLLLLGGERSARFLRVALDELADQLPAATRIELRRVGHTAADNTGQPAKVAEVLRPFFAGTST